MNPTITISPSFEVKKQKILSDLAVPDEQYTDLSPKGSVDEKIVPLIRDINALPGLVTTSSCAGRISVFLEGPQRDTQIAPGTLPEMGSDGSSSPDELGEGEEGGHDARQGRFVPTGGKGSGKWLFVSHDPVSVGDEGGGSTSMHELFGLTPGDGKLDADSPGTQQLRLVRFHFEPMILHIMTTNLHHAHPVLSASSIAGFRESGLQSLRPLSDPSSAHPIVAVRSSGLALESVIGYYSTRDGCVRSLVSEEYLGMLVALANERFGVNAERVERFRGKVVELYGRFLRGSSAASKKEGWEDAEARRERKRAEGLLRKKAQAAEQSSQKEKEDQEDYPDFNLFE